MNKIFWTIGILFISGCTMIPFYHRPSTPVASTWPGTQGRANSAQLASEIGWREFFADARLQKLIELALINNRDLRVAMLNVEQIRAQYRILTYAQLPSFDAAVTGNRQRDVTSSGAYTVTRKYTAHVDASYEIDLFGHIRSLKAQTLEQYFATQEAQRSAQITLVSEVATQYLNEQAVSEELLLSQQTLKAVQAYYKLVKGSYDLGNTSELDLRSTEAQVQTALANIAMYERLKAQADDALTFLIGQPIPDDLPPSQSLADERLLADLPAGLPSDLLQNRPDILEAEHQLKAANANIGAARAAFFPRITLTAAEGTATVKLARLFTPGTQTWDFAPQISIPIFDQNTNLANLDVAHIEKKIQVAQYEKAIQNAFREVSDTLIARSTYNDQVGAQRALVTALKHRYYLADQRYRNGVDNYLTVLTAQQDLYTSQQNFIQVEFARLSNLITFYKVLGGGWHEHTPS